MDENRIEINLTPEDKGVRIDVLLCREVADCSRATVQKWLEAKMVTVDGKTVKANYKSRGGEKVVLCLPPPETLEVLPEAIPLDVLYEDGDILVVNKARGMVVHPATGNNSGTLVNALLAHCSDLSGINGVIRPGIVHRLDKDTTGVMVVAKNDRAHLSLAEQIGSRTASRAYLALVHGSLPEEQGIIKAPIGRHPTERKKMAVVFENSKEAQTSFTVKKRFSTLYTLIECRLQTGRTHQIRVHMNHIGHPVVCDPLYGPRGKAPFAVAGQLLHSACLKLRHPVSGEEMEFQAPLPSDMEKVIRALSNKYENRG